MAQLSLARPQRTASTRSTIQRDRGLADRATACPWLFLLPTIVFFIGWAIFPIVRVAGSVSSITGRFRRLGR